MTRVIITNSSEYVSLLLKAFCKHVACETYYSSDARTEKRSEPVPSLAHAKGQVRRWSFVVVTIQSMPGSKHREGLTARA